MRHKFIRPSGRSVRPNLDRAVRSAASSCCIELLEGRRLLSTVVGDSNHVVIGQAPTAGDPTVASQIVGYNPTTHVQTVIDGSTDSSSPTQQTHTVESNFNPPAQLHTPTDDPAAGADPGFVFAPDTRTATGASNMTTFPWRTIGRMWIQWPDGAEASATGEMIGPRDFLTAGHCVYDASHGGWASQIYFSAGQDGTELDDPYFSTNFRRSDNQYYGEAAGTFFRSYSGWTSSGDWNYDMAVVTLDRNLGNFTGWMGYGYNDNNSFFQNTTMNTAGYPGDLTPSQYDMFNTADQVTAVNTLNVQSNKIDIYPGQSGSPLYYYDGTNRTIYSVVSSEWSNTSTGAPLYNQFTRITGSRFSDIGSYVTADATTTDRPDLTSYDEWYNTAFDSHTSSTTQAGPLSFTGYVRNTGTGNAGSFNVSFYASTNSTISSSDTLLGTATISSLSAFNWGTASLSTYVPASLPVGTYYVGYVIDSGNSQTEYAEYDNTRLMPGFLSVTAISPDRFEPNDSMAAATNFGTLSGSRTESSLSIHASGNGDFYRFTAGANGTFSATVTFTHAAGDIDVQLLDSAGTEVAGSFGTSNTESFTYAVTKGATYYLNTYGYSGALNPSYSMTLTAPAIAPDRFEANDTLAAATAFGALTSRTENGLNIHAAGNGDFYKFTPSTSGQLVANISFVHADGDIDMQLLSATGTVIGTSAGTTNTETISTPVVSGTTYVLNVYGYNNAVNWNYDMSLAVTNAPAVTSKSFDYNAATQRLTYVFNQNVSASLSTADLTLSNLTSGTTIPAGNIALAYNSGTNTATFTFPGYTNGVLPDGNYHAVLSAAGVTNSSGTPMASNDTQDFFFLGGDFNHDRTVNIVDLGVLAGNWQASGRTFSQGNANYAGNVDIVDLGIVASHWQQTLAAPPSIVDSNDPSDNQAAQPPVKHSVFAQPHGAVDNNNGGVATHRKILNGLSVEDDDSIILAV